MEVQRVFLAAQLLGDAADRRASITELTGRSNADIVTDLSADSGYTELGELDAQRAEHVAAAYRHDCLSAHGYFADALESPPVRNCPRRSPWSLPPTTRSPRRCRLGTATGSCWPNTSTCTSSPTAATTLCVPDRHRRPCSRLFMLPNCSFTPEWSVKGN